MRVGWGEGPAQRNVAGSARAARYQGAEPARFHRVTLKRHNPRTVRKNVGADYHGCLIVSVRQGADLYRRIEGWAGAIMAEARGPE